MSRWIVALVGCFLLAACEDGYESHVLTPTEMKAFEYPQQDIDGNWIYSTDYHSGTFPVVSHWKFWFDGEQRDERTMRVTGPDGTQYRLVPVEDEEAADAVDH